MRRVNPGNATFYLALVLGALYTVTVCSHGIPSLRHDWSWPRDRYAFLDLIINSTSGWSTFGLGEAFAYPSSYMVGSALGLTGLAIGPFVTLAIFIFAIGTLIALGSKALAESINAGTTQIAAVEVFALFNPWVYNETVAGHLYMLMAYGASFALLAELLRPSVRPTRLALLLLLALPQLQFFLVAMLAIAIHAVVRRVYFPWLVGVIAAMPIWIGLVFDRGSLLSTPYTLAWETSQSVDPMSAPVLAGYFANYTAHFTRFQIGALWALVAYAFIGVIATSRRTLPKLSAIAVAVFLVAAMGTRGVFGAPYANIVLRFPESALFRELYDLLAFVAIGYCVLFSCVPSRKLRVLNVGAALASAVMATAWITFPPSSYWVDARQLPRVNVVSTRNTRFALYPPYQPMQFKGEGSGADPDAYARPVNVTPLNKYLEDYPINVALSSFALYGELRPLAALSTSLIVKRPWLTTDMQSLRLQVNGEPPSHAPMRGNYRTLSPLPEVTSEGYPVVGGLVNALGSGNVFFGDARQFASDLTPANWRFFPRFVPVEVSNAFLDENKGWIDVRFDFASDPKLGQGLGGAVTTNPNAVLPVHARLATLVNIQGTLLSQDGRPVHRATRGYEWVRLPGSARGLRCNGRCVVSGQAALEKMPALNPPPRSYQALTFDSFTPWLLRVKIPANAPPVVRYNVAFDPSWVAFAPGKKEAHFRLDATVNGWLLSPDAGPYVVYLVHRVALAQFVSEILAVLCATVLIVYEQQEVRSARE